MNGRKGGGGRMKMLRVKSVGKNTYRGVREQCI